MFSLVFSLLWNYPITAFMILSFTYFLSKLLSSSSSINNDSDVCGGKQDAQKVLKQQLTGFETRPPVPTSPPPANGSVLAERLDQLQTSTQGWKKRIEPSDAVQFSVAGRMSGTGATPPLTSPVIERKKKTPRPTRFRSKNSEYQLFCIPLYLISLVFYGTQNSFCVHF